MKILHLVLSVFIFLNLGCAEAPVRALDAQPPKDGQERHTHPASVVFKHHTKRDIRAMLNVEGGEVPRIDHDNLSDFFLQNYYEKPHRLTPAEHAVMVGDDIAEHIFALIAGLVVLGVIDKNWRPF